MMLANLIIHGAGSMIPLLEVSHLSTSYRYKHKILPIIKDVTFDIFEKETLGLVGESGCGKSTIAKTLAGLITPDAGSIKFNGTNPRKNIQLVFQDTGASLNPRMTIEEIIKEPLIIHSMPQINVIEILELVGLSHEFLSYYPHELSGGQKGRVCIARALILKPKLIIFDESVASLDVSIQAQIINLLIDLRERFGLTYLFISHDLSLVRFLCSRVAVMHEGSLVEIGTSEEIYNTPRDSYTKELIHSMI